MHICGLHVAILMTTCDNNGANHIARLTRPLLCTCVCTKTRIGADLQTCLHFDKNHFYPKGEPQMAYIDFVNGNIFSCTVKGEMAII